MQLFRDVIDKCGFIDKLAKKKKTSSGCREGSNEKRFKRVRELKREIMELIDKENRMWFQRAKVLWAKDGDKISKFFHSRATQKEEEKFNIEDLSSI